MPKRFFVELVILFSKRDHLINNSNVNIAHIIYNIIKARFEQLDIQQSGKEDPLCL